MRHVDWLIAVCCCCAALSPAAAREGVVIGSKVFTESVVLGEIATQLLVHERIETSHQRELGGTAVLWSGLLRGDIDCYPEYTGTLRAEIFAKQALPTDADLRAALAHSGAWASAPLGFNNTYILGMRKDVAARSGITRMSDLARHAQLRFGFSNEFLDRADGWPGVRSAYGLTHETVSGLAHDLAYRALAAGSIDVTDLYSTDAEIVYYDLAVLEDDRAFFPSYEALFVCRADVPESVRRVLERLAGTIDAALMARMNSRAKIDHVPESEVAQRFTSERLGVTTLAISDERAMRVLRRSAEHLAMVAVSLTAAVLVAIPLGVVVFRRPRLSRVVFAIVDVLQTLPALALLVFLIPWLGIGYAPAIVALFLYSVLPILRNTHTGLSNIPLDLRESAIALGLSRAAQLRFVELPLAARSILAGIKTAAVINVGTATLGALIGAGGYGQPILTGIRLDDTALVLEGAIPAAVLALLVQAMFAAFEKRLVKSY